MIRVVCAIVEQYDRVLITQRSEQMREAMLWEFPGGKVEQEENEANALVREIQEELAIYVEPQQRLSPVVHQYSSHTVELIPYICSYAGGVIQLLEHRTYHWVLPQDLLSYNWCPADVPVVKAYLQLLEGRS